MTLLYKDSNLTDESSYIAEIKNCIKWYDNNNLLLYTKKTKELNFDFRKCDPT